MRPIRYGQWKQWSDAYHGWRDGRAGIPARHLRAAPPGPATTPHREALIRQAQDSFGYEQLAYSRLVAKSHRQVVAERARLESARSALAWAQLSFDFESSALTEPEARRRRLGEEHHPESVIVQRRHREHRRLVARAQAATTSAYADISAIEAQLAEAVQEAQQHHAAAVIRVVRIHEHIHRRLAIYRRALIRAHPEGAWVNSALSVRAPEIPGWALPDAYLPEGVPPSPSPGPPEDEIPAPDEPDQPSVRTIVLTRDVTRFGSDGPPPGAGASDGSVGYVVLGSPVAAPWHFTIVRTAGLLKLRTRGYEHGPYMGGEAVGASTDLTPGDFFDFAERRYTVVDSGQLEDAPLGRCDLVAADLYATSASKVRLSGMSFVQRERTLLAVLGPSGAGKSSLFQALLGELPLESGRLFFRGLPMATHARQIRAQLGFVPQQTELHESLTVEATLRYGFGLRSPAGRGRRAEVIDRVLGVTKLAEQRDQLLSTLSGGQLRRVSIALELLTDPPLLLLDEPTSGLDANMDRLIMSFLRELAEGGLREDPEQSHTVIVVTHATEHLAQAHQVLVVVRDGAPAYSGPPRQIRRHFGFRSYADLMSMLLERPAEWAGKYRAGRMVTEARRQAGDLGQPSGDGRVAPPPDGRQRRARAVSRKLRVLLARQCTLLRSRAVTRNARDRTWFDAVRNGLVVSLPLIIAAGSAALAALVAGRPGLGASPSVTGSTALTLLTTLCVLSGQALTYSDVVNELPFIRREFRAGVGAFPVLVSKWLVYGVVAVMQAALITAVFCLFPGLGPQRQVQYGPEADLFLGLAALTVSAMTLGLLLSALATKLEHAVALVTATSITQIALNGVTSDLSRRSPMSLLAAALPDRWGLAAAASSIDLRGINRGWPSQVSADALWRHSSGQWRQDITALTLLSAMFFGLAVWRLHTRLRLPKVPKSAEGGQPRQ